MMRDIPKRIATAAPLAHARLLACNPGFRRPEKLRIVFRVAAVDEGVINLALTAGFKNFENAVHYYSAIHVQANCLVTRDKKDFPAGHLTVLTPPHD